MYKRGILILAMGLLEIAITVADLWVGREFSLSHIYLIPVALGSWYIGGKSGLGLAVFSVVAWFAVVAVEDTLHTAAAVYWDTATRLIVYLAVAELVSHVRAALTREEGFARTDSLTGAANNRTFRYRAEFELHRARRTGRPLSLAYIDLDDFKAVNDRFGHLAGDEVLRVVVRTMQQNTRTIDLVARMGGDEFALLLPETDDTGLQVGLEKLQAAILAEMATHDWPADTSIGSATFHVLPDDVDEMITHADTMLYRAKELGKHRIEHTTVGEPGQKNTV
jgi:diguanylate cyclase (GGDEF)-like protein